MDKQGMKNAHLGAFASVDDKYLQHGLSKRELFAAMAMQGLCAGRSEYEQPGADAKYAVELADHLLKALANEA